MNASPLAGKALAAAVAAAAYYLAARAGLELALSGAVSNPLWPASGLALAAAVALGPAIALGVFLGAWLAYGGGLAAAGVAAGCALQAYAGRRFLHSAFAGSDPLARRAGVVRFALLTPAICLIGSGAAVASLAAGGGLPPEQAARAWLTWWLGDSVAALIALPLLFAWRPGDSDELGEPVSPLRAARAAAAAGVIWLSVAPGFGDLFPPAWRFPLSGLPVAALLWAAWRFGSRGATAGAAMLAALVLWRTLNGLGPFAPAHELGEALLLASVYVAAAALTAFLVRSLLAELDAARAALERQVSAQGQDLWTANAHLRVAALGRREDGRRIQLYRRIVSELPVGIAVLRLERPRDPESWLIVEFNAAGMRLSGAGGVDPAGMRLLDFAPELRGGEVLRACADAVRRDRESLIPDFASTRRMPGRRFSIRVFPLGRPLVGLAFEDVTARKAAEDALARSNDELTQFAFVASHDLQAPLRKAAAFAEQIRQRLGPRLDDTSGDFLRRMTGSLEGMQALIDALLALAQVSSRSAPPRAVDLSAVARDVLADLDDTIARSGARVVVGGLPTVQGDPQQMRQLLQNLLVNALKFTSPGRAPSVRLSGRAAADGRSELVVEDDGVGFDMQFAGRLFQPFQRLHGRQEFPGSGMGLAICRRIVERRGGTISVESAPGRGTRFTIGFPAASAPRGEEAALARASV